MFKPSVIIIGAGLGGLSTGTYAQMNGYQCQIFEHGRPVGGAGRRGFTDPGIRKTCRHAPVPPGRPSVWHIV
jgi:phytoene dehydrogenase-like protein